MYRNICINIYIDIDIKIHTYIEVHIYREREFTDLYQCVNTLKEQESGHNRL